MAKSEETKSLEENVVEETNIISEAEKKAKEIIEAAEKEAEEIVSKAKGNKNKLATSQVERKMVPIALPAKKGETHKTVGLNGKIYQIKRGETVMVPEGVYEIIKNSQSEDAKTLMQIQELINNSDKGTYQQ